MNLCYLNPQLLNHDWAVELVQRLGGKFYDYGWTSLIWLFTGYPENTDFNSNGFKLLWMKEKNINVDKLKEKMHDHQELKERVIAAIPDAIDYYNNESSYLYDQFEE